jgi:hypothetical protein
MNQALIKAVNKVPNSYFSFLYLSVYYFLSQLRLFIPIIYNFF